VNTVTLEELHNHYGSWAELTRRLGLGVNSYQYWQRIGYIPKRAQSHIERITKGFFKADDRKERDERRNDKED
jgi:hypothetical protein